MQPIGHHTVLVHQVADAVQHRFEVVLLGLAAEQQVEGGVGVLLACGWLGWLVVRVMSREMSREV